MKKVNNCPVCKCEMWLPDELCESALKSAQINFFCAYGHKQHLSEDCIKAYWQPLPNIPIKLIEHSNVVQLFKGKNNENPVAKESHP